MYNKHYPHPVIAREGWLFAVISIIVTLLVLYFTNFWVSIPFILITIFIIQFFRDPKRVIPQDNDVVLSPADGKIICIEECQDVYQDIPAQKISIFMNVFNVHSNRSPVDGEVVSLKYVPGKFFNADFDKASTENERNAMIMQLADGTKLTIVQIAGLVARRILCYTAIGNKLKRGDRYGFIRFGSRVDIYVPINSTILVAIGDKVSAAETILAKL